MKERIGINADSFTINGDVTVLEKFLARFVEAGFSCAEIPIHGMDCLLDGSLCRTRVSDTRRALSAFPLEYTVHSPDHLNLADEVDPDTHARALRSTVDFASEIGAKLVVYHGSARSGNNTSGASLAGATKAGVGLVPLRAFWADEIERLGAVADYAAARGVTVAVENIFRQSAREVTYRIDPRELAGIVSAVDSPALGICFDFGHAFISSGEEGFSIEEALRAVTPRLAHVHIHDNFGKSTSPNSRPIDMMFKGAGDLHLPPGWGAIPYDILFPIFAGDFRGVFTLELQPRFADKYREALEWIRRRIGSLDGRNAATTTIAKEGAPE